MNIYWVFGDGVFVFARACLWSSVTQRCWSVPVRSITALCWPPPRSPGEPSQQIWHLIFSVAVAVPSYLSARCPRLSRSHLLNPPPSPLSFSHTPSPISPNLPLSLKRGKKSRGGRKQVRPFPSLPPLRLFCEYQCRACRLYPCMREKTDKNPSALLKCSSGLWPVMGNYNITWMCDVWKTKLSASTQRCSVVYALFFLFVYISHQHFGVTECATCPASLLVYLLISKLKEQYAI